MRALLLTTLAFSVVLPSVADAKNFGLSSPTGREIYSDTEKFSDVIDQNRRQFVIEAAIGAGPEGNLGIVAGWLMPQVKGLELYAGLGIEANPAVRITGAVRYLFNFFGWRPYVGAGYLLNRMWKTGTISHNAFFEVGYSWKVFHTYHLTLGVGARRVLHISIDDEGALSTGDVDRAFLEEQIDDVVPWLPTISLRFSRAF